MCGICRLPISKCECGELDVTTFRLLESRISDESIEFLDCMNDALTNPQEYPLGTFFMGAECIYDRGGHECYDCEHDTILREGT